MTASTEPTPLQKTESTPIVAPAVESVKRPRLRASQKKAPGAAPSPRLGLTALGAVIVPLHYV